MLKSIELGRRVRMGKKGKEWVKDGKKKSLAICCVRIWKNFYRIFTVDVLYTVPITKILFTVCWLLHCI